MFSTVKFWYVWSVEYSIIKKINIKNCTFIKTTMKNCLFINSYICHSILVNVIFNNIDLSFFNSYVHHGHSSRIQCDHCDFRSVSLEDSFWKKHYYAILIFSTVKLITNNYWTSNWTIITNSNKKQLWFEDFLH